MLISNTWIPIYIYIKLSYVEWMDWHAIPTFFKYDQKFADIQDKVNAHDVKKYIKLIILLDKL